MVTWHCTGSGSSSFKKCSRTLKPNWKRLTSQRFLRCISSLHPSFSPHEPTETIQREAQHAAMNNRARRGGSAIGDCCMWNPRLFWSENKVSMRNRLCYKRHASSAVPRLRTRDRGSCSPLAPQHSTMMGPYASRVQWTSFNSISLPGLRHAPSASRRKVSPAHVATVLVAVRHT